MGWIYPHLSRVRSRCGRPRSYGNWAGAVQIGARVVALALIALPAGPRESFGAEQPVRIVVLGDSLSAGLGLPINATFPVRLERALRAQGMNVQVIDAGVSGGTSSDGLARADWSVPEGTDAVILELGANDALRGIDPKITRTALDGILQRMKERGIAVLLAGMRAPRNMGTDYAAGFDAIFPELAARHSVLFYPFFLDGVATDPKLNQSDGMHPNAAGIDVIVERIGPKARELVAMVQAARK